MTVFCRVLLEEIFRVDNDSTREFKMNCVTHAMFHDWDEALLLRDISHKTKYNSYNGEQIRSVLDNLSKHLAVNEFLDGTSTGEFVFGAIFTNDESVNSFCKVCDWLALAFFIKREQSMGNQNLDAQETTVKDGLRKSINRCVGILVQRFGRDNIRVSVFEDLIKSIYEK